MSLEHLFFINRQSMARRFWKSLALQKVQKREPETTIILVLYVYYGFLFQ